jgi:hypothetical protein
MTKGRLGKRYEKWQSPGGEVDIRVFDESPEGVFAACVEAQWFRSNSVSELKRKINAFRNARQVLQWEPVIVIVRDRDPISARNTSNVLFDVKFERYFKSVNEHRGKEYKSFEVPGDARTVLQGSPGYNTSPTNAFRGTVREIPYTPKKWLCLMGLLAKHNEIKARLEEALSSDEVEDLLETLTLGLIEHRPKEE